jgi:hypothetical protein
VTVSLLRFGGTGRPFSPNRLAVAFSRLFAIVLAVYLIRSTRADGRVDEGLLISLAVFVGLYVVFARRGELRPVMLYLIFTGLFAQVRLFADQTGIPVQFEYVIAVERALFGGGVPTVWLQEQLYEPGRASLPTIYFSAVYFTYFVAFQICAFVIWIRGRAFFPVYATSIVIAAYIGLMTCILLPTAPPWLAGQEGNLPPVHRIVEEQLSSVDSSAYDGGASVAGVNQVAAMPSLHMALTVLVALTIWSFTRGRLLRLIAVLYAASMAFALVYLGEHYVTDEIFGVVTAFASWRLAHSLWAGGQFRLSIPRLFSRRRARMPVTPAPSS